MHHESDGGAEEDGRAVRPCLKVGFRMPTGIFATLQKSSEPATARGRVERNLNALYGIYFPESPLMRQSRIGEQ
jgi:hypothetical protein